MHGAGEAPCRRKSIGGMPWTFGPVGTWHPPPAQGNALQAVMYHGNKNAPTV